MFEFEGRNSVFLLDSSKAILAQKTTPKTFRKIKRKQGTIEKNREKIDHVLVGQ